MSPVVERLHVTHASLLRIAAEWSPLWELGVRAVFGEGLDIVQHLLELVRVVYLTAFGIQVLQFLLFLLKVFQLIVHDLVDGLAGSIVLTLMHVSLGSVQQTKTLLQALTFLKVILLAEDF